MKFSRKFIDQVKEANDIIEVAEEYFPLIQQTSIYQANCIHGDKDTPSLTFFPDTQSFYCFGCGAGSKEKTNGSDVIDFVQWIDNLSYSEAVTKLAERKDIPIPKGELTEEDKIKQKLMAEALYRNRGYWHTLQESEEILEYLYSRGIDKEDINLWRIGYVSKEDTTKASGRLVFAIINDWGKTVGFSYRNMQDVLPDEDHPDTGPKYFNSPKSPIFEKGAILYGLHNIKKMIREKKYLVIAEGFADTILGQKYGCPFVSTMGTSLTKEHISMIKKHVNEVIVWYDGDESGINAMLRHLVPLRNEGLIVKVLITPGDPDEKIIELEDELEDFILNHARLAGQYEIDLVMEKYRSRFMELKFELLSEIAPIFEGITSQTEIQLYSAQIAKELGIDPEILIKEINENA